MRIFVTNDDGIDSLGIRKLVSITIILFVEPEITEQDAWQLRYNNSTAQMAAVQCVLIEIGY